MRDIDRATMAQFEEQLWLELSDEPLPPSWAIDERGEWLDQRPRRIAAQVKEMLAAALKINGPIP